MLAPKFSRVTTANPSGGVADVNHRLIAGLIIIHRAAAAGKPCADAAKTNRRIGTLIVRQTGKDASQLQRIYVGLRSRCAMLNGECFHITEAELIHEIAANGIVCEICQFLRFLHEEHVTQFGRVLDRGVRVIGFRVTSEDRAKLPSC